MTKREAKILETELRKASKDALALIGSFMTAVTLLNFVGYKFSIPPIRILLEYWDVGMRFLWNIILFFLPFDIDLSSARQLTFITLMSTMFLRGRFSGYSSLQRFSHATQRFLGLSLLYGLLAVLLKASPVMIHRLVFLLLRAGEQGVLFLAVIAFIIVWLSVHFFFICYVWLLRKTRFIPLLIRAPWMVALIPAVGIVFLLLNDLCLTSVAELKRMNPQEALSVMDQERAYRLVLLPLEVFLQAAAVPVGFWYIRLFMALVCTVAALLGLDFLWTVSEPILGSLLRQAAPQLAL